MKSFFSIKRFGVAGGAFLLFACPTLAGQITPSLQKKLQLLQPQDTIRVVVHLKAQVDWRLQPAKSPADRREFIKRFSQEKQAPVLSFVRGLGESCRNIRSYWIFNGFAVTATKQAVLTIADQQAVDFVTDIGPIQMSFPAGGGGGPVNQWNIIRVRAPETWLIGYNGSGILVGEMDTGVDAYHPAFGSRWEGAPYGWYDALNLSAVPIDENGHGTHTMGILTAGNGKGVAPGATFMAVRIMRQSTFQIPDVHEGFEWIASLPAQNLPVVVNNSWGQVDNELWPGPHLDFWYDVINWRALGIIPIFCNGNSTTWDYYPWDPGKFPTVIGVGATTSGNQKANFSLPGPSRNESPYNDPQFWSRPDWSLTKPDLTAPGTLDGSTGIYSTLPNGGYGYMQGTSQAAPHVAGAIALMTQASRNSWHYDLNFYDLYDLLIETSNRLLPNPPPPQWPSNDFGWGLLDCYEAVNGVLNYHLKSSSPTATGPNNGDRVAYGGGKWHLVYETGGPLAKYIRYTVSTDNGATWSQEANGPTGERIGKIDEGGSPALSVEPSGDAHVVWGDGNLLRYSQKLAASPTWTMPVTLYDMEGFQETPSLVVDPATSIGHVAFVNASVFGRSVIYGWFDTQSPVLNTITLDAGDVSHPAIGLGADGPHVAWRKKSSPKAKPGIYYACYSGGWVPEQISDPGVTCEHPDLVVSPYDQTVLVAWEQGEGTATDIWSRRKISGLGWQALEQVCSTPEESRHPVIAANAFYNNRFYAAWSDSTSGNDWEVLVNADYGSGWEPGPYPNLSNTPKGSKNPQIGFLSSPMIEGTMVLAYGEGSSSTPSLPTSAYNYVPVYEIRTATTGLPFGGGGGQNAGRVNRPAYRTALLGCYPNPLVNEASLEYEIGKPIQASLKIYNVSGQVVKVLTEGRTEPGHYNLTWDGRDASGRMVSSGIYFYRLNAGGFSKTNKLVVVR